MEKDGNYKCSQITPYSRSMPIRYRTHFQYLVTESGLKGIGFLQPPSVVIFGLQ